MTAITEPASGEDSRDLWKIVQALAKAMNALGTNFSVVVGAADGSTGLSISDSNAVLTIPPAKADRQDSGGGDALDAQWWNVAVGGEPMFCQFNSGAPQASLPGDATVVNPD